MPFAKRKVDDEVENTDEVKVTEADDQLVALVDVKKEKGEETVKKCGYYYESDEYVPYGVKSFAELETWKEGKERADDVRKATNQFVSMMGNIVYDEFDGGIDVEQMGSLFEEFKAVLGDAASEEGIVDKAKKLLGIKKDKEQPPSLFIWKSKDRDVFQWLTVYSNNYLDDDFPQNIITKDSHIRYVDMVDKGKYPLPELWLYHIPEYKFGQAEWVAYDDSGFALAGGIIDNNPAATNLAKELSVLDEGLVRVSHSMPVTSVKYDASDSRSIMEHQTIEISPLPDFVAATQLTGFVISKEVDDMPIDRKKRDILEKEWGINSSTLDALEEANKLMKQGAETVGLESKEKEEVVVEKEVVEKEVEKVVEVEVVEEKVDEPEEEVAKDKSEAITREEVAEGILAAVTPLQELVVKNTELLQKTITEMSGMKADNQENIEKTISETPIAASIASLIQSASVIGNEDALVDGRTKLSKSMPEETFAEDTTANKTGINFLDNLIGGETPKETA